MGGSDHMSRTFDRRVQFDERSRSFPVREALEGKTPRAYTWRCSAYLDQGSEGACVGFSWAHELAARPAEWDVDYGMAMGIYRRARQLDDWPGEDYEGTSVLAGAKTAVEHGWIGSYRWAFGLEDLVLAVGYQGPAILGLNWHNDMMEPDDRGFVSPGGGIAGGHAILCRGVSVRQGYFTLRNSWGPNWGLHGDCRVRMEDMASLLADDGEACVPQRRQPYRAE